MTSIPQAIIADCRKKFDKGGPACQDLNQTFDGRIYLIAVTAQQVVDLVNL